MGEVDAKTLFLETFAALKHEALKIYDFGPSKLKLTKIEDFCAFKNHRFLKDFDSVRGPQKFLIFAGV